jgi:hypothetical protein
MGPNQQNLFDNIATGSLALVPEPPSWGLMAVGIVVALVLSRIVRSKSI